jgi:hypothetical protein
MYICIQCLSFCKDCFTPYLPLWATSSAIVDLVSHAPPLPPLSVRPRLLSGSQLWRLYIQVTVFTSLISAAEPWAISYARTSMIRHTPFAFFSRFCLVADAGSPAYLASHWLRMRLCSHIYDTHSASQRWSIEFYCFENDDKHNYKQKYEAAPNLNLWYCSIWRDRKRTGWTRASGVIILVEGWWGGIL